VVGASAQTVGRCEIVHRPGCVLNLASRPARLDVLCSVLVELGTGAVRMEAIEAIVDLQ